MNIKVYLEDTNYISLVSISEFEEQLPDYFVRTHRSFVINALKISRFTNHAVIHKKAEVPVGRTYKEEAIKRIKEILLKGGS